MTMKMKKILFAAYASLGVCLSTLPLQAATYYWDGGGNSGQWGDNVNWGNQTGTDPNLNVLPTEFDTILFRDVSPAGNVAFTNDYSVNRIRLTSATVPRTLEIDANELVDRTLTLAGGAAELLDQAATLAGRDMTFSGVPNAGGYRLKLQFGATKPINVASTNSSLYISSDISGVGGFSKTGLGTLYLSGTNTYADTTTVTAGTVLVNSPGSISASSAVTVNSGGTLGGDGTINGTVTVDAGGTLSPGASVGTLTLGSDLTLSGNLFIELDKSLSPSNDVTTVSGTLTNAGTGTVTVANLGPALAVGDSFQIFNKAVLNGEALTVVSSGGEVWTNKLAVDGSIAVLLAPAPVHVPIITSVDGAGTASVTINYTNTIAGTNYVVQYLTNLNSSTWTDLSPVPAAGTTSSTSDTPPASDPERYYRVYYVNE